jgi:hypothetical protein
MNSSVLSISFIIILWWVAVWGFLDTLLHSLIKGSKTKALFIYGTLAITVLALVYLRPELLEHFV